MRARLPGPGRRVWLALLAVLVLAAGTGLAVAGPPAPRLDAEVVIATGGTKGVYYTYGSALADRLNGDDRGVRASVVETTGSVDNLRMVGDGRAGLAFVAGDAATAAYAGTAPFDAAVPVRAVARVYDDYVHLVVPAGSPVRALADLAGRRVSVGSAGSGTALIAERLLALADLPVRRVTVSRLGINESVAALQAGRIDAFFWSGGLPTAGVVELAAATPVRLVPLGALADPMRARHGSAYRSATVPAGVYGGTARLTTIAVPNLLVCHRDADPELVEHLLGTLFGGREALARSVSQADALDERAAIATFPIPLHPGAQAWFGAVKP